MIIIKSDDEIEIMREAAKVTARILRDLKSVIKPGMTTFDVDEYVEAVIRSNKMIPAFKGYMGFPASTCCSVNEEIVHGIPSKKKVLSEGDIISVDTGTIYKGYVSDAARTYPVGKISEEAERLIKATEEAFFEGMKFARVGYRLSDISHAVQERAEREGYSVIRDYTGHGVGRNMHEDPQIPNYGKPGRGPRLQKNMVIAVEPMIAQGKYQTKTLSNGWTAVTQDGKLAAHYENTVVISEGEPELLTLI